jgi:hypothetical protein
MLGVTMKKVLDDKKADQPELPPEARTENPEDNKR